MIKLIVSNVLKAFRKIIYIRSFFTNKEACIKYTVKSLVMK